MIMLSQVAQFARPTPESSRSGPATVVGGCVFGQPSFDRKMDNDPSLSFPVGVAVDGQSNLSVTDGEKSRVIGRDWALAGVALLLIEH